MTRRILSAVLAAVVFAGMVSLYSCGGMEEDEIRPILSDLIDKSAELNEIYFGKGLPLSDSAEKFQELYDTFDVDVAQINYHPVSDDCGYSTIDEIKAATLEVFTPEYSEYLFERAFSGISDTLGSEDGDVKQVAGYAMYLEQDGILTARMDLAEDDILDRSRSYDVDRMEIVRQKDDYVIVKVPVVYSDESGGAGESGSPAIEAVEMKLVNTADGWRLDTPTY